MNSNEITTKEYYDAAEMCTNTPYNVLYKKDLVPYEQLTVNHDIDNGIVNVMLENDSLSPLSVAMGVRMMMAEDINSKKDPVLTVSPDILSHLNCELKHTLTNIIYYTISTEIMDITTVFMNEFQSWFNDNEYFKPKDGEMLNLFGKIRLDSLCCNYMEAIRMFVYSDSMDKWENLIAFYGDTYGTDFFAKYTSVLYKYVTEFSYARPDGVYNENMPVSDPFAVISMSREAINLTSEPIFRLLRAVFTSIPARVYAMSTQLVKNNNNNKFFR